MTVNINAANITSIRLADQSSAPTAPASNFIQLYADTNGDIATVKGGGGSIKIATSPATGTWTLTVDGTGTAARLNANQTFSGANTFSSNIILSNGIGIDFSATPGTGTSELFDDYEEGTWTPTVVGTTAAGTATYVVQQGYYTKVGRHVFVHFQLTYNSHDGTGNFRIGGLPFSSANLTANRTTGSVMLDALNWSGGTMMTLFMTENQSQLQLYGSTDNAGFTQQQCVNQVANTVIYGAIAYAAAT